MEGDMDGNEEINWNNTGDYAHLLSLISVHRGTKVDEAEVEITRDELLGLISVKRAGGGQWCVVDVRGEVHGNVCGNVLGDVGGKVFGSVCGAVYSNYQLGLVASQQQMYWVSLVGWEVWDAWYASRADVRSAADGVVAASQKMAAANTAERSAWLAMKDAARASPLFNEDSHAHHRAERITRE